MAGQKRSKKVIRRILLAVLVFLVFILQNTPGMPNHIGRASFFYLVPLIICIGVFETTAAATWLGLFAGLLWDCVSAELPGYHSIMLMCFGCIASLLVSNVFLKNLMTAMVMGAVGIILYCFLYWFFFLWLTGAQSAGDVFWSVYFPTMLLTVAVLPLAYLILSFMSKKLKD